MENLVSLKNTDKSREWTLRERAEVVLTSCDKNDVRSFDMISRKLSDLVEVSCSVLREDGEFGELEKDFVARSELDEDARVVVKDMIDYLALVRNVFVWE